MRIIITRKKDGWFARKFFPITFKNLFLLVFIWGMVGFTMGTETLLGPVRWATTLVRDNNWGDSLESLLVKIILVFFVFASLVISLGLVRLISNSKLKHVKFGLTAIIILATLGALFFWMNPQIFGVDSSIGEESLPNSQFTFGPYPTKDKLQELKAREFTAIISLLHPAVAPFEPKLLGDERRAAQEIGIEMIHIPMLPWVSENRESLEKVRELAAVGQGKYYVHCYLGKDRVNVVRRIIESTKGQIYADPSSPAASPRKIEEKPKFERGERFIISDGIFVTPYPTDEEFLAYILTGRINQVVSLLDPDNPRDVPWIEKERILYSQYRMSFQNLPLSSSNYDPYKALSIAQLSWLLPRPLLIHGFLSPSTRSEALVQAMRSNLPPLPPVRFSPPLSGGQAEVIAPNIAVGPRPTGPEFGGRLTRRGVRIFGYLGESNSEEAVADSAVCQGAGIEWRAFLPYSPDQNLFETVSTGGPWYLYGPLLSTALEDLKSRFGPAIPEEVRFNPENLNERDVQRTARQTLPFLQKLAGAEPDISKKEGFIAYVLNFGLNALPDLKMIILLGPLFLLYAGLGASFAGYLRSVKKVRTPFTRKVFHFHIFTMAGILHLSAGLPAVVLYGSIVSLCVLYAVWRGDDFPFYEAMARQTDAPHRSFFIIVPLITTALGGGISNLFFTKFAYIGYFVGGWGDAVGEPVGTRWGKHRYKVPSLLGVPATRSLEGSAAVFFCGALVAFIGFYFGGFSPAQALTTAVACGGAGALIEAFSSHGLDNLTMQVAASATAQILLG